MSNARSEGQRRRRKRERAEQLEPGRMYTRQRLESPEGVRQDREQEEGHRSVRGKHSACTVSCSFT